MANEVSNRNKGELWDPFFDRLSQSFFNGFDNNGLNWGEGTLKTDVSESDKDYRVKVDVPGVDKRDVKLNYQNNVLNLEVKKDSFSDHEDSEHNVTMSERHYGVMRRSYALPDVDQNNISAKVDNGVLTIVLPKSEEAGNHQINIE